MSDLDAARLADELAIRNLIARVAQEADDGALDDYVALYTEDAVWDMPDNPTIGLAGSTRQGRADIRAGVEERRAAGLQGPGSSTRHLVTTISVDVDGSDVATGRCYWMYYGDTATGPTMRSMGEYRDTYRRTESGWKVARRVISMG